MQTSLIVARPPNAKPAMTPGGGHHGDRRSGITGEKMATKYYHPDLMRACARAFRLSDVTDYPVVPAKAGTQICAEHRNVASGETLWIPDRVRDDGNNRKALAVREQALTR